MKYAVPFLISLLLAPVAAFADCPPGISGYRNYVDGNTLSLRNIIAEEDGDIQVVIGYGSDVHRFHFDGTTAVGQSSLSLLIAAGMAGNNFSFHASGCDVVVNGRTMIRNISLDF